MPEEGVIHGLRTGMASSSLSCCTSWALQQSLGRKQSYGKGREGHTHTSWMTVQRHGKQQQHALYTMQAATVVSDWSDDELALQGTSVPEDDLKASIEAAATAAHQAVRAQEDLLSQAGDSKVQMPMQGLPDPAALTRIAALRLQRIEEILRDDALGCSQRGHAMEAAKTETLEMLRSVGAVRSEASSVFPSPPSRMPTFHVYSSI